MRGEVLARGVLPNEPRLVGQIPSMFAFGASLVSTTHKGEEEPPEV